MPDSIVSPRHVVAGLLLDAGCVSARIDEPFRLPSGWASPVYMDCRRLIAFPAIRRAIVGHALALLNITGALAGVASIAGAEASGIALAAWLAERLDLPLQYVRKRPIGHTGVEGTVAPGSRVLLVDDLVAAGQSKIGFLRALADAGAVVDDVMVVFDYATFGAERLLAERGVRLHALAGWEDVLAVAKQRDSLAPGACAELEAFLHDPAHWSLEHGGIGMSPAFLA